MRMTETAIAGVVVVHRERRGDARGFLARLFDGEALRDAGWPAPIAQVNHTFTEKAGTVRGMHYQRAPHAEAKLVSCIRGRVYDVAVDLRRDSPTYLAWTGHELSADNGDALLIPEGCAHGFQALSDDVELVYCHSAAFEPSVEGGVHPTDPAVGIVWPLPVQNLSARDAAHPLIEP